MDRTLSRRDRAGRWPAVLGLLLALFALGQAAWAAAGADRVAVPVLSGRVVDLTGHLPSADHDALEAQLEAFEQRKGSQLAVLVLPTTQPETIEQFGIRVADQWKLGRRKVDDGAILIVALDDHALRIEVGYGLEGALNDATSKRIVDETIVPSLRNGDLAGGIHAGVDQIIRVIDGEPLPPPAARPRAAVSGNDLGHLLPLGLVLVFVLGGVLRAVLGPLLGALVGGGVTGAVVWLITGTLAVSVVASVAGFAFILVGGRPGGGFWIGGPGGGGFGGGGGGGFSGGGGGFGGGGASGKW